jgi:2-amino-4-hydroxy-6-hydroxymethyldihydropteridine diphosphokinase
MANVTAYIGLGSNLDKPELQITQAQQEIAALAGVDALKISSLYASSPMGPQDQPDYVNAVMSVTTTLSPMALLHALQTIENTHGRVRERRWGARTLDLDILLYGDAQINLPELTVPHPGIAQRAFVLLPLRDCAPDLVIPGLGHLDRVIEGCPLNGVQKLSQ